MKAKQENKAPEGIPPALREKWLEVVGAACDEGAAKDAYREAKKTHKRIRGEFDRLMSESAESKPLYEGAE